MRYKRARNGSESKVNVNSVATMVSECVCVWVCARAFYYRSTMSRYVRSPLMAPKHALRRGSFVFFIPKLPSRLVWRLSLVMRNARSSVRYRLRFILCPARPRARDSNLPRVYGALTVLPLVNSVKR